MALSFRETKPEFVALLAETVDFLNEHQTDFMHQLGGARNFGAGIVDCSLVNPLYEEHELRRVFDRGKSKTQKMEGKDETWEEEYVPTFEEGLAERVVNV